MSKFILPSQKGTELFPNAVVAPPIVRWVGIDARSTEAQAILAQYGSALTAFHAQQSHNHSLSGNTQSRAARQIAPNLGVTYVNQGGTEYVTLDVKPAAAQAAKPQPQPVSLEESLEAKYSTPPCWFPTAADGQLMSESLDIATRDEIAARASTVFESPISLGFTATLFGKAFTSGSVERECAFYPVVAGATVSGTPFPSEGSVAYTSDTGTTHELTLLASGYVDAPASWTNIPDAVYPPVIAPFRVTFQPLFGGTDISVPYREESRGDIITGSKIFGDEKTARKYFIVTWTNLRAITSATIMWPADSGEFYRPATIPTESQPGVAQLVIIEATESCPALVGFSYLELFGSNPFRDVSTEIPPYGVPIIPGWSADDYSYTFYPSPFAGFIDDAPSSTPRCVSGGKVFGSQTTDIAPLLANRQFWFMLKGAQGLPTLLKPFASWVAP